MKKGLTQISGFNFFVLILLGITIFLIFHYAPKNAGGNLLRIFSFLLLAYVQLRELRKASLTKNTLLSEYYVYLFIYAFVLILTVLNAFRAYQTSIFVMVVAIILLGLLLTLLTGSRLFNSKDPVKIIYWYILFSGATIILFSMACALLLDLTDSSLHSNFAEDEYSDGVYSGQAVAYYSASVYYIGGIGDIVPRGAALRIFTIIGYLLSTIIHVILIGQLLNTRRP